MTLQVSPSDTVKAVKAKIKEQSGWVILTLYSLRDRLMSPKSVDTEKQQLTFKDKELQDVETLTASGVVEGSVVSLALK